MFQLIYESLSRQAKGLDLLGALLAQEYRIICERKMEMVAAAEFSIQELIRQLVAEKEFVMGLLKGRRLREYAAECGEEDAQKLLDLAATVEKNEQKASRQAGRNSQLSLGLLDQNEKTLKALFKEAVPEKTMVYGRRGAMRSMSSQGALLSGRF